MIKLSIVIPCYNEEKNLNIILDNLLKLYEINKGIEIVLVDNGSTDSTSETLSEPKEQFNHFIKFIRINNNIGYGHGIMEGVRNSSGETIAWTHADLQTDIMDVLKSYNIFVNHPDYPNCILKGRRVRRNLLDSLFTGGMSILSTLLLREQLSDVNAQPKMFHRNFIDKLTEAPNDFSLDLYFLFQARFHGFQILEYPVQLGKRLHGESKGGGTLKGKWKMIHRTLAYMLKLKQDLGK